MLQFIEVRKHTKKETYYENGWFGGGGGGVTPLQVPCAPVIELTQQENSYDRGIYMLQFIEVRAQKKKETYYEISCYAPGGGVTPLEVPCAPK